MPSQTDDPFIPPPTNPTYGCLAGPVQFAVGSDKRTRPTIPAATTSFALGSAATANVQCRARRAPYGRKKSAADLNRHRPHGAVLLEGSGQLKGGHTSKPPELSIASETGELSRQQNTQQPIRSRGVTSRLITR